MLGCLFVGLALSTVCRAQTTYTASDLGDFGLFGQAWGFNDQGTIVGQFETNTFNFQAYYYANGTLTDMGNTLGPSGSESSASAINNYGLIVGNADVSGGGSVTHAFSYANGQMTDLGTLGGTFSTASAVNDAGTIAGWSYTGGSTRYPFVYADGRMTSLGFSGVALGINEAGTVVGYLDTSSNGFIYSNGQMTTIAAPGGGTTTASDINDSGVVVGGVKTTGSAYEQPYDLVSGTMTILPSLTGSIYRDSSATKINNSGTIIGEVYTEYTVGTMTYLGQQAWVYSGGMIATLNSLVDLPGINLYYAAGINNEGQIVARGDNNHFYLIAPIPEPWTYAAVLGVAVLGFGVVRRRRSLFGSRLSGV